MSQLLTTKFVAKSLAATVSVLMLSTVANAASAEQKQIQQLRQEVETLKTLIQQQQQVQLQQASQIEQVKAAPQSTLAGLKSKAGANVNIYGFVRADAQYKIDGADGIFSSIDKADLGGTANPKNVKNPNSDRFYATAKTTRLGLDFKAPVEGADVGGKIEVDFAGTNDALRIRHAYLTYNNWLVGQTTSNFLSGATVPEMIDFSSPLGIGTKRTPMVRYSDKINANASYAVALEKGADANRLPAATAKVDYKFDKGVVNARALVQEVRARNEDATSTQADPKEYDDKKEFGWGLAVGANFKPVDALSLNVDYSHVKGDNFYIGYTGSNTATVPDGNDIDLAEFDAVTVGATYQFTPKVRSTLGYGAVFFDKDARTTVQDGFANKKLQQAWLNVLYSPVKPLSFGAEYVYGKRDTVNNLSGKENHVGFMAKYDF
ncbi:DcaP family trimeric outer membrane transporter [Acinetobacter faecalis]|uniref:DcaP family trimeric outer membrane transporter n=1 Tax=Acinetobacter faecalis TaxID=2665161 RepID=UPI002A90B600|nr:DcaP family trimeric outer membrane transporter [Acinetobacter faecalis]MDY6460466.1 DcaP family trimeric outer membrane transporter [Acinetobacter faecalis]